MNFGAAFCRGVEPFLANLEALINAAEGQGLGEEPAVISGRAVFEDIDGFVIYSPWGGESGDCARHTREVQAAIARIEAILPGVDLPRPDAEQADPNAGLLPEVPTWMKFAGFGVIGLVALHYLTPFFKPARRRLAGRNRR